MSESLADLHAIVPVAGIGTRLRPHTYSAPKVLLHVAGKTILGHILDELKGRGIRRLTLVVGYRGDMIRDFVDANYDFETTYVHQQELLGLGHAIWLTRESARDARRLLIVLGDTVFKANLKAVLSSPDNLIGVKEVENPHRFGIIQLDGDRIVGMEEKPEHPKTNLAIVGIYLINQPRMLFESLDVNIGAGKTTKEEFQLTDALQRMIELGAVFKPFMLDGWYDCGKPETLLETNRAMLSHPDSEFARQSPGRAGASIIIPPVFIHPTAEIDNCIIGPYVTVAEKAVIKNALIRDSIVSRKAHVENILLDRSIISDNARVESRAYRFNVGDSSEISLG